VNEIRGGSLQTIHSTALEARNAFVDVVTTSKLFHLDGTVSIDDRETGLTYTKPTRGAHRQLASRAGVPQAFYERIRDSFPDVWQHTMSELTPESPALFRCIRSHIPSEGATLRAVLSDKYQVIDNVDVISTVLQAFIDAGLDTNTVEINGDFDADAGRLRLRCTVESVGIHARELVSTYRSPFDGRTGQELPMIFAGIEFANSETGNGAYTVFPRAVLQVCRNGMTRDIGDEIFRRVHLGARLEQGVVQWSDETRHKQLELIASAAKDAITTFISPEYLARIVDEASQARGIQVKAPDKVITAMTKQFNLSDDEASNILTHFIRSSDTSVLGLGQAVTAAAQLCEDGDRQSELECAFWQIVGQAEQFTGA